MTGDPAPSGPAVVTCDAVTRVHGVGDARRVAVDGVSCRVEPGARVALTGPSGSGKSTLLYLMAGLDDPTSGQVRWPALAHDRPHGPGDVGVVFQGPSLLPELTVAENVALPQLFRAGDPAAATVAAALARTGLADQQANLPDELSGGQVQRAALARMLPLRPFLILADEPTGQLDRATADAMVTLLLEAADELDAALVVATHDPRVAARLEVRWAMRDGVLDTVDPTPVGERAG